MRFLGVNRGFSSTMGHVFIVGFGGAIAQFLNILLTPVITRIYSPEDYALWALVVGVVIILGAVVTLRYELAVVLPENECDAANIFLVSFLLSFGLAAIFGGFIYLFEDIFLSLVGVEERGLWLYFLPLLMAFTGLYQTGFSWLTRRKWFFEVAVSGIVLALVTTISQIVMGWCGYHDAWGLVAGTMIGQVSAAVWVLTVVFLREGSLIKNSIKFQRIFKLVWKYRAYPFFMTPYTLAGVFRERGLLYFINILVRQSAVGHFALAQKIMNLPTSFVSSAIRPVLFQKAIVSDPKELEKFVYGLLTALIWLGCPFLAYMLLEAEGIFAFLFGNEWREAGFYASLLAIPAFLLFITNFLDRLFDAKGKQKLAFQLEIFFSFLTVSSFVSGLLIFKDLKTAIILQAAALSGYYIFWLHKVFEFWDFRRLFLRLLLRDFVAITSSFLIYLLLIRQVFSDSIALILGGGSILLFFFFQLKSCIANLKNIEPNQASIVGERTDSFI